MRMRHTWMSAAASDLKLRAKPICIPTESTLESGKAGNLWLEREEKSKTPNIKQKPQLIFIF